VQERGVLLDSSSEQLVLNAYARSFDSPSAMDA
jgi:hypothetical protein